jgi:hypothetical protein
MTMTPAMSSARDPRIAIRLAGSISFAKPVFGAPTVPVPEPLVAEPQVSFAEYAPLL